MQQAEDLYLDSAGQTLNDAKGDWIYNLRSIIESNGSQIKVAATICSSHLHKVVPASLLSETNDRGLWFSFADAHAKMCSECPKNMDI